MAPTVNSRSPWGTIDDATKLADGIVFVSTPSHGGIWLSPDRVAQLPKGYDSFIGSNTWHEEDNDAPMIAWFFGLCRNPCDEFNRIERWEKCLRDNLPNYDGGNWTALKEARGV